MIRVKRPMPASAAVAAALAKPMKSGLTELDAARAYYASVPPPKKSYKFVRYKQFDVCHALDLIFHGKCAYCESPYRAVDAQDIEHFRPKGGVSESKPHPGYWWLAANWSNLLPSCPACNQRRKHAQYTPGMSLEEFELQMERAPAATTGKGNAFPVRANNWVTGEMGDLAVEDPLLINPCERDPGAHLEWVLDRDPTMPIWAADPVMAILRPRLQASGAKDEYAAASIAIYGLNRGGVVRERAERIKELQHVSQPVVDAIVELAAIANQESPEADRWRKRLVGYRTTLRTFADPAKRYSAMAAAYLAEFDEDLRLHLQALPANT